MVLGTAALVISVPIAVTVGAPGAAVVAAAGTTSVAAGSTVAAGVGAACSQAIMTTGLTLLTAGPVGWAVLGTG